MITIGGILFGSVVGYLAWYAIRPGDADSKVTLQTVGAFIGVVAGAAIVSFLQSDVVLFAAYCFGLGVGFFFTPVQRYFHKSSVTQKNIQKQEAINGETQEIDQKWGFFENFITSKMNMSIYQDNGLYVGMLNELDYTVEAKAYILKRYAREHTNEGYEIGDSVTRFGETVPIEGVEHTHLYISPFFLLDRKKKNGSKAK
jgi:hypothetical protein